MDIFQFLLMFSIVGFGLLVVQINLDHVQLIVARLHDAGLVESHPFENDGELED